MTRSFLFDGTPDDFRRVFVDMWRDGALKETGAGYAKGIIHDWRGIRIYPQLCAPGPGMNAHRTRVWAEGDDMTTLDVIIEYLISHGYEIGEAA